MNRCTLPPSKLDQLPYLTTLRKKHLMLKKKQKRRRKKKRSKMPRLMRTVMIMKIGSVCSAGKLRLERSIQSLTDNSYTLIPPRRC